MYDLQILVQYTKTLKLLVVEDNKDSREQFVTMLENLFDTIYTAEDGIDGLKKLQQHSFDIVITDINMPKMNGLEMIRSLREKNKDVITIVLSAHNEERFKSTAKDLLVDSYLYKPVDLAQLIEALMHMMQKKKEVL